MMDKKYDYSLQARPIWVFGAWFLNPKFAGHQHDIIEVARTDDPARIKVYTSEGLLCEARQVKVKELMIDD